MNLLNIINSVVIIVGLPIIIGSSIYIGRKLQILDSLSESMDNVKHNLNVICNYLVRNHRDFDSIILKSLSPYEIQEGGYDVLRESGFLNIFRNNRQHFFDYVDKQKPTTKLNVENHSIVCYSIMLESHFMNPIKEYLYEHPDSRDYYPTLAGVYIRDVYLLEHPEIAR